MNDALLADRAHMYTHTRQDFKMQKVKRKDPFYEQERYKVDRDIQLETGKGWNFA